MKSFKLAQLLDTTFILSEQSQVIAKPPNVVT